MRYLSGHNSNTRCRPAPHGSASWAGYSSVSLFQAPHHGSFAPPSPYSHAPPGPPPNPHGRKKAVIIGISYKFSRHELKGCINDAKCMKYLLTNRFHFPESSIVMLTGKTIRKD
ncbi:UNVERIFIED_CONTAM: Metacaspase-1 [Sesamum calycinum]|uniref:Metacaspase-1 n=1 Tax=Sesamum calycinum TaxID=2727403 RepID=A0AAW2SY09_9LAMI